MRVNNLLRNFLRGGSLPGPFRRATNLIGGGGGGGGGGGPGATARYWRLGWERSFSGANPSCSRLQFVGSDGTTTIVPSGGTAISSSAIGGFENTKAFDANDSTFWVSATGTTDNDTVDAWVGYDFGDGNDQTIAGFIYRSRPDGFGVSETPRHARLQYSDDGATWSDLFNIVDPVIYPSSGEVRTFTDVARYTGGYRYWRLRATALQAGADRLTLKELRLHVADTIGDGVVQIDKVFFAVSSNVTNENAATSPKKLLDNITTNTYSTLNTTVPIEWVLDFGPANAPLATDVTIVPSNDFRAPRTFTFDYSSDGSSWTPAITVTDKTDWSNDVAVEFALVTS